MAAHNSEIGSIIKSQCASCAGERRCRVQGFFHNGYAEDGFWGCKDWLILQCCGCHYVFVRTDVTTSEDISHYYDQDGKVQCELVHAYEYWPSLLRRATPEWMGEYGIDVTNDAEALDTAMIELYRALNADLPMLAGIGIRTAFDVAAVLLDVDGELSFAKKLDALVDKGCIREVDRSRLEIAVDAGSASAHRGWKPSTSELATMMSILENFIFDAFVMPNRRLKLDKDAAKVRSTIPPRQPRRTLLPETPSEADKDLEKSNEV